LDLDEIRKLIQLVKRTKIGELEVTEGGRTVRISAWPSAPGPVAPVVLPAPLAGNSGAPVPGPAPAAPAASPAAAEDRLEKIVSPMVGTFYRAPAPDADPYVEVGDRVDAGQTVCIVEAMKLMNEIESEVRGRVAKIAVENGQPVEFGQVLFQIDPQG
jgi:acetyl-CoA carboxylase biotin carboxyl carrier protein